MKKYVPLSVGCLVSAILFFQIGRKVSSIETKAIENYQSCYRAVTYIGLFDDNDISLIEENLFFSTYSSAKISDDSLFLTKKAKQALIATASLVSGYLEASGRSIELDRNVDIVQGLEHRVFDRSVGFFLDEWSDSSIDDFEVLESVLRRKLGKAPFQ